jgi:hypothetical protein
VEAKLFRFLEPPSTDVAKDGQFFGLDHDTQEKAIAKLKVEDLKKSMKVKDALEKTCRGEVTTREPCKCYKVHITTESHQ